MSQGTFTYSTSTNSSRSPSSGLSSTQSGQEQQDHNAIAEGGNTPFLEETVVRASSGHTDISQSMDASSGGIFQKCKTNCSLKPLPGVEATPCSTAVVRSEEGLELLSDESLRQHKKMTRVVNSLNPDCVRSQMCEDEWFSSSTSSCSKQLSEQAKHTSQCTIQVTCEEMEREKYKDVRKLRLLRGSELEQWVRDRGQIRALVPKDPSLSARFRHQQVPPFHSLCMRHTADQYQKVTRKPHPYLDRFVPQRSSVPNRMNGSVSASHWKSLNTSTRIRPSHDFVSSRDVWWYEDELWNGKKTIRSLEQELRCVRTQLRRTLEERWQLLGGGDDEHIVEEIMRQSSSTGPQPEKESVSPNPSASLVRQLRRQVCAMRRVLCRSQENASRYSQQKDGSMASRQDGHALLHQLTPSPRLTCSEQEKKKHRRARRHHEDETMVLCEVPKPRSMRATITRTNSHIEIVQPMVTTQHSVHPKLNEGSAYVRPTILDKVGKAKHSSTAGSSKRTKDVQDAHSSTDPLPPCTVCAALQQEVEDLQNVNSTCATELLDAQLQLEALNDTLISERKAHEDEKTSLIAAQQRELENLRDHLEHTQDQRVNVLTSAHRDMLEVLQTERHRAEAHSKSLEKELQCTRQRFQQEATQMKKDYERRLKQFIRMLQNEPPVVTSSSCTTDVTVSGSTT